MGGSRLWMKSSRTFFFPENLIPISSVLYLDIPIPLLFSWFCKGSGTSMLPQQPPKWTLLTLSPPFSWTTYPLLLSTLRYPTPWLFKLFINSLWTTSDCTPVQQNVYKATNIPRKQRIKNIITIILNQNTYARMIIKYYTPIPLVTAWQGHSVFVHWQSTNSAGNNAR